MRPKIGKVRRLCDDNWIDNDLEVQKDATNNDKTTETNWYEFPGALAAQK
jgi:hypothetical protein